MTPLDSLDRFSISPEFTEAKGAEAESDLVLLALSDDQIEKAEVVDDGCGDGRHDQEECGDKHQDHAEPAALVSRLVCGFV